MTDQKQIRVQYEFDWQSVEGIAEYDADTHVLTMRIKPGGPVDKLLAGTDQKNLIRALSFAWTPTRQVVSPSGQTIDPPHMGTIQFGGDLSDEEIHLEASDAMGATLCSIELFPRDEAGQLLPRGWSRGGGDTGPNCRRVPCPKCRDLALGRPGVQIVDHTFGLDWSRA
jgi:hypothetical protein